MSNDRRSFLKNAASLGAGLSLSQFGSSTESNNFLPQPKASAWPINEGPDTPKLILNSSANASKESMRLIKQFGVDYVLMGGPRLPWTEERLREILDRFKAEGLTVINMMLPTISEVI